MGLVCDQFGENCVLTVDVNEPSPIDQIPNVDVIGSDIPAFPEGGSGTIYDPGLATEFVCGYGGYDINCNLTVDVLGGTPEPTGAPVGDLPDMVFLDPVPTDATSPWQDRAIDYTYPSLPPLYPNVPNPEPEYVTA